MLRAGWNNFEGKNGPTSFWNGLSLNEGMAFDYFIGYFGHIIYPVSLERALSSFDLRSRMEVKKGVSSKYSLGNYENFRNVAQNFASIGFTQNGKQNKGKATQFHKLSSRWMETFEVLLEKWIHPLNPDMLKCPCWLITDMDARGKHLTQQTYTTSRHARWKIQD